jgi:hypothetical protein
MPAVVGKLQPYPMPQHTQLIVGTCVRLLFNLMPGIEDAWVER